MAWKDIRFAVWMLAREPAFAAVVVVTLALGIGANTAIFTLFNAILLQSLPVREPGRLVLFSDSSGEGTFTWSWATGVWRLFSFEAYEFLRQQPLPFEAIAAVRSGEDPISARVAGASLAERAQAHLISGSYVGVMGCSRGVWSISRVGRSASIAIACCWRTSIRGSPATRPRTSRCCTGGCSIA